MTPKIEKEWGERERERERERKENHVFHVSTQNNVGS